MPVSEKKKLSNAKWDKANMTVLACKVRKDTADRFKECCAAANTTPNAVLQQAVKDFIGNNSDAPASLSSASDAKE